MPIDATDFDEYLHFAHELADAPARPSWNLGDFFGMTFANAGRPLPPAALDPASGAHPEP